MRLSSSALATSPLEHGVRAQVAGMVVAVVVVVVVVVLSKMLDEDGDKLRVDDEPDDDNDDDIIDGDPGVSACFSSKFFVVFSFSFSAIISGVNLPFVYFLNNIHILVKRRAHLWLVESTEKIANQKSKLSKYITRKN